MSNVLDTAIMYKTYNSRAVSADTITSKGFRIDQEGNLYASFYIDSSVIGLFKSTDNGFTWNPITFVNAYDRRGNIKGDICHLMDCLSRNSWVLVSNAGIIWEVNKETCSVIPYSQQRVTAYYPTTHEYKIDSIIQKEGTCSSCGDPDNVFFTCYSDNSTSKLTISEFSFPRSYNGSIQSASQALTGNDLNPQFYSLLPIGEVQSNESCNGKTDVVIQKEYLHVTWVTDSEDIKYGKVLVDDTNGMSLVESTLIETASLRIIDPQIVVDGNGVIGIAYGNVNGNNTDVTIRFAYNDTSWHIITINKPINTVTAFDDFGQVAPHISLISNVAGGFMLSAIFSKDGYNTIYGIDVAASGTLGDWKQLNTKLGNAIGNQFFRPMNDRPQFFGDKSTTRIAYQIGNLVNIDGHENFQIPVWQESLDNLNTELTNIQEQNYVIDPLQQGALRIDFRVLGTLDSNINYYKNSQVGEYTKAYMKAFDKIGSSVKVQKYEPIEKATDTGKSAYDKPVDYTTKVLIDPQSYDFPAIAKEKPYYTEIIERDIRKVFFKPDFFIGRSYIKNDGGYIKRTVWTLKYMNNSYEISQVVPRFLNNEICFYEANAYVVGPSNDPFRKLTLPSET